MNRNSSYVVLILSTWPWAPNTRGRKIAESFARRGADVTVIYPSSSGRMGWSSGGGSSDGVRLIGLGGVKPIQARNTFASLVNLLIYAQVFVLMTGRALRERPDLIVCQSPALLPLAVIVARTSRARLIFDARERPATVRMRHSLARWLAIVEPLLYRAVRRYVDAVWAVAGFHVAEYVAFGFRNVVLLRNLPSDTGTSSGPLARGGPRRLVYLGTLMPGRGIEELIDAVAKLESKIPNLRAAMRVDLIGPAAPEYRGQILENIAAKGVEHLVSLRGAVRAVAVKEELRLSDGILCLYRIGDPGNDSLPNKFFDAISAGRPIIGGEQREVVALIRRHELGWPVEALNADSLAEAIRQWSTSKHESLNRLGVRARNLAEEFGTWEDEFDRACQI